MSQQAVVNLVWLLSYICTFSYVVLSATINQTLSYSVINLSSQQNLTFKFSKHHAI